MAATIATTLSPATVLNIDPSVVTALCALMSIFGVVATFVINALIRINMQSLLKEMDTRYATKDELKVAFAIRTIDEASGHLKRSHHGGD